MRVPAPAVLLALLLSIAAASASGGEPRSAASAVDGAASAASALHPGAALHPGPGPGRPQRTRLVTAPEGNRARYRVREQLARLQFPNDAVGETGDVTGTLVLEADGTVVSGESKFVVGLRTLRSDSERRDRYVQRNTLETERFPSAVFVPTALRGLPDPLPATGEMTLLLEGDLTIHGVTRPVVWEVTARAAGGGVAGAATTSFTFATFDMAIPRVGAVLSIRDEIRLEYDFRLVPES